MLEVKGKKRFAENKDGRKGRTGCLLGWWLARGKKERGDLQLLRKERREQARALSKVKQQFVGVGETAWRSIDVWNRNAIVTVSSYEDIDIVCMLSYTSAVFQH